MVARRSRLKLMAARARSKFCILTWFLFFFFQSARRARLKRKAARAKTKFYKYKACGKRYKFS
jgi:hypothetical protein